MKRLKQFGLAIGTGLAMGLFAVHLNALDQSGDKESGFNADSDDPIIASFERELHHAPTPARRAERLAIEDDLLYEYVNRALWTEQQPLPEGTAPCSRTKVQSP